MAVGPTIGSLLIRATKNILSVFYAAGLTHLLYAICVWFIIPESVSQLQMKHAKEKFEEEQLVLERERKSNPVAGWLIRLKRLFTFLTPLAVFYPEKKVMPAELSSSRKNSTWRDRDWSLFCLVISYGCISSIVVSEKCVIYRNKLTAFYWALGIVFIQFSVCLIHIWLEFRNRMLLFIPFWIPS